MCGIAGIVDFVAPVDPAAAAAMGEAIAHRGPDDSGLWSDDGIALAFRRLSILDLSAAGHQPMLDPTGRYVLVFNGEIYNYVELRAELEADGRRFTSGTDTEVLLASYERWGHECVTRFNGMWAFALWDTRDRTLFCSRDRFGIKPFFYRHDGTRFTFASEPTALRAAGFRLEPNLAVIRDFLDQSAVDETEQTFFTGVVRLPPAHSLTLDARGLRLHRYWELPRDRDEPSDPVAAVREALLDAVRMHLRSDVPVGTALSGGLDSSAIACLVDLLLRTEAASARPVGARQKTFTAFFDRAGFDEREYAAAVVAQTNAAPHWITFDAARLVDDLPRIVRAQNEPFGSTSIIAQWYVMETARASGVTVMLDGQGGDELFGGYHVYFGPRFADLLVGGRLLELASEMRGFRRLHGASALRAASALARPLLPARVVRSARSRRSGSASLVGPALRGLPQPLDAPSGSFPDHLRRDLELQLTRTQLPELLRYEDRNSMAHSIEARVPLLDHRLVELAFSLAPHRLIERGRTKAVLRDAVSDLIPASVRDRTDKLGFVTPERDWFRGPLGDFAAEVFADPTSAGTGLVDSAAVRRRLAAHQSGALRAGPELWRALNVVLWARDFDAP